jgi:hypothetical protein
MRDEAALWILKSHTEEKRRAAVPSGKTGNNEKK